MIERKGDRYFFFSDIYNEPCQKASRNGNYSRLPDGLLLYDLSEPGTETGADNNSEEEHINAYERSNKGPLGETSGEWLSILRGRPPKEQNFL